MSCAAGPIRPWGKVPDARCGRYVSPRRARSCKGAHTGLVPYVQGVGRRALLAYSLGAHSAGRHHICPITLHNYISDGFLCPFVCLLADVRDSLIIAFARSDCFDILQLC